MNSRPYSSDQKDRDRDLRLGERKKPLVYEGKGLMSFKSPYDSKLTPVRGHSHNKMQKDKEAKSVGSTWMAFERPHSAKSRGMGLLNKGKDELMITNGFSNIYGNGNKKYSSVNREQLFRKR